MKARVKQDYKWSIVTAFAGLEYVKYEWRDVPVTHFDAALKHPYLDADTFPEMMHPESVAAELTTLEHSTFEVSKTIPGATDYQSMTVDELKALAKERGIKVGRKGRARLIKDLENA